METCSLCQKNLATKGVEKIEGMIWYCDKCKPDCKKRHCTGGPCNSFLCDGKRCQDKKLHQEWQKQVRIRTAKLKQK